MHFGCIMLIVSLIENIMNNKNKIIMNNIKIVCLCHC